MGNPEYERLIQEARTDLVTHMAEYVRGQQMPLHLTGEQLKPQQELANLQEIWRRMYVVRERLRMFAGLYACPVCEHLEGEHHASDCQGGRAALPVRRPPGWVAPPPSEPATVVELIQRQCAVSDCPYNALPGREFCRQHDTPDYAREYEQKPTPSDGVALDARSHADLPAGDRMRKIVQDRVTAKEAVEVMERIITRKLTVVEATNDHGQVSRVFVTGEGHRLQFFNDSNELDYLERIRMPDGREGEYDDWCPEHPEKMYNPADEIDDKALMRVLQW